MIPEPGDANREITVTETFNLQTDDELSDKELKQIEANDQAIQTILLGLLEDIYAAEKKVKLFNEWKRFTFNEEESIESYYHRFLKLMNDLKRNKHFSEKIASNLKFLNNLQPEWSQHVTIVHQTKDLHTVDYTQLYDFLKYNQKEKEEAGIQLQAKEYDLMVAAADLDEIEEVNANYILMANLQQASTSGTQTDSAPVYDTDGSAEIQLEKRIKELNNIVLKTGQSIQTIHMLLPKPDSFYRTEQKMALGYQNPFYLKQAQKKQQSLYDGKVLLEKHDPPVVHDSEETLQLAQENPLVAESTSSRAESAAESTAESTSVSTAESTADR
nr:hypothetical protein [Tanacetum cinerariifolium]